MDPVRLPHCTVPATLFEILTVFRAYHTNYAYYWQGIITQRRLSTFRRRIGERNRLQLCYFEAKMLLYRESEGK